MNLKKIKLLSVVIVIFCLLVGCSQGAGSIAVKDGAFVVDSDSLIARINQSGEKENYPLFPTKPSKTERKDGKVRYIYELSENASMQFTTSDQSDNIEEVRCFIPYAHPSLEDEVAPMFYYMGVVTRIINPKLDVEKFQASIDFSAFDYNDLQTYEDSIATYDLFTLDLTVDYTIVPATPAS